MVTRSTLGWWGPTGENRLENTGNGRLPHRHRAGDPDDERDRRRRSSEKGIGDGCQLVAGLHLKIEQAAQRQIGVLDHVDVEKHVDTPNLLNVGLVERQRRVRPESRPGVAVKVEIEGVIHKLRLTAILPKQAGVLTRPNRQKMVKPGPKTPIMGGMGGFDAALKVGSDTQPLNTRVQIEDGRLMIRAADQTIGDWSISDLDMERVAGGYRVQVEGEQILLDVKDVLGFQEAIAANQTKKKSRSRSRVKRTRTKKESSPPEPASVRSNGSAPPRALPEPQAATETPQTERPLKKDKAPKKSKGREEGQGAPLR